MDFFYIWHNGRPWSKEFLSAIPTPGHDLGVKVMNLELLGKCDFDAFMLKFFKCLYFKDTLMDLFCIWHDGRSWSKEFLSAIPTPGHDLGVKVTDSELLEKKVILMCLC